MPRPRNTQPAYILHSKSGRGRLQWYDAIGIRHEKLLPGPFGSPESLAAKARLELQLATSPTRTTIVDKNISVAEVLIAFLNHAEAYYVDEDGEQTKEVSVLNYAIRQTRELYGLTPAINFGPQALKSVRQKMIDAGLCRSLVNHRIDCIKRAFKWAAAEELVPASVYESLRTLAGLRRGRTTARESEPVGLVDDATGWRPLSHTCRRTSTHVRAMIEMMRHTGMRPAEVCGMTLNQIERGGGNWMYRPRRHKTAYHGIQRTIHLGPRARAVLASFLASRVLQPDDPIFSPKRAREERFAEMRQKRKSPVQPSQISRKKPKPKRVPTDRYTPSTISHTVAFACDKAFPTPAPLSKRKDETTAEWKARLTDDEKAKLAEWQRQHRWHPYQLRHSFATRVRKNHGLEAAQVLLGHSRADVTQVYAERDESLAATVAASVG